MQVHGACHCGAIAFEAAVTFPEALRFSHQIATEAFS
jgi:hypothetical protein